MTTKSLAASILRNGLGNIKYLQNNMIDGMIDYYCKPRLIKISDVQRRELIIEIKNALPILEKLDSNLDPRIK